MRLLALLLMLAIADCAAPAAAAQSVSRVARLGYLWVGTPGTEGPTAAGLRQGLADLGYVEGRTIRIDWRYADGHPERLPEIAAAIVAQAPDVILSPGTQTTRAFLAVTRTIPIVATTGDPVGSGFIVNLARPGGNVTGLSLESTETLAGKWLEFLKEIAPGIVRVAALYNGSNSPGARQLGTLGSAASRLGI